jgi:hypothetical protein
MTAINDFLPARESDLFLWAANFDAKLQAGAVGGIYGLNAIQIGQYHNAFLAAQAAYTAANQNSTRTPDALTLKNTTKNAMVALIRQFAGFIQENPATTDEQRSTLQLRIRDTNPTPIDPPAFAPGISIVETVGSLVKIRLHDTQNPENVRGKPVNVTGAAILTAFGSVPPLLSDPSLWTWRGNISRVTTTIDFANAPSGTTAWITAVWFNAKSESGPPALPVSVQVPGQLAEAA